MAVETKLTKRWVGAMEGRGAVVVPYVASQMQPSGYPDRIVWHAWWTGWIELKGHRTRVQRNQRLRMRELNRRRAGSAYVFRFVDGSSEARWAGTVEDQEGGVLSTIVDDPGVILATLQFLTERERAGP